MNNLISFQQSNIRKVWHNEQWYFSIIDIVGVLIEQDDFKKSQSYWTTLKKRLKQEGNQFVTNCDKLKLRSSDGKSYLTDVANTETILRLIQSIPSKKAEPLKLWLAKVGNDRIKEIQDPSLAQDRAREYWKKQGSSKERWKNRKTRPTGVGKRDREGCYITRKLSRIKYRTLLILFPTPLSNDPKYAMIPA